MKITFDTPKSITVIPEQKKEFKEIQVIQTTDNSNSKEVFCILKEIGKVILWKDQAYDQIGNWTDNDVINRLKEIYA